jgi:hypothetical protein
MPGLSRIQLAFLCANAVLGLLIGLATARTTALGLLKIPTFLWLVAGLFGLEMLAGRLARAHPATIVSMPIRVAALFVSFAACYAVVGGLSR